jgi:hypothetical protein
MSSRVAHINKTKDTWRIASDLLQEHGLRLNKLELERLLAPEVVLVNDLRSDAECRDFRRALGAVLDPTTRFGADQREIYCTPVFGNYDQVAYWMIVLNGSPPKGALLLRADLAIANAVPVFLDMQMVPHRLRRQAALDSSCLSTLEQLLTLLQAQLPDKSSLLAPCVFEVRKDGRVERAS